ncbi:HpcH/HpaI aldolase/citrate lyase family protein [Falsibacillus albus]|uniref:Citrate lyase subunit beta n=1 Tax=Falsibacillus albus TaxID=2478915 RepID=A0A3L7JZ19_9BACI|nr:HpcH/HpaI aldolase/citrate lyase family protein [Falsibacillus albus]RLQ95524.1 citrate lyase subunit beta [Falsibacillus albus]
MQHFSYLTKDEKEEMFYHSPIEFSKHSPLEILAYSLGATLYMPGNRRQISDDLLSGKFIKGKHEGLTSIVLCLEDSIGDDELENAEWNIVHQLQRVHKAINAGVSMEQDLPMVFIRVRTPRQMFLIVERLGEAVELICGFVFPKFSPENGELYLTTLRDLNEREGVCLYGMPILESASVIYREQRDITLMNLKALLDKYHDLILNIRIGGTDFSGLFGLRRNRDTTIYDILVIRDCISDIINLFGRSESDYVISGPVWEYFNGSQRILKPQIRQTPFEQAFGRTGTKLRSQIINRDEDGLIREVLLDKSNGLVGKTIIHPSHIKIVQALNVITLEEHMDACSIMEHEVFTNGVIKSQFSNKMNEIKPHLNWARKILLKSKIYGVLKDGQSFIDLLGDKKEQDLFY